MDRRFQVFVSSTYEDLREERAAVISALLQLDCIPAGMELFPAADDDSWTLIKSVIWSCGAGHKLHLESRDPGGSSPDVWRWGK